MFSAHARLKIAVLVELGVAHRLPGCLRDSLILVVVKLKQTRFTTSIDGGTNPNNPHVLRDTRVDQSASLVSRLWTLPSHSCFTFIANCLERIGWPKTSFDASVKRHKVLTGRIEKFDSVLNAESRACFSRRLLCNGDSPLHTFSRTLSLRFALRRCVVVACANRTAEPPIDYRSLPQCKRYTPTAHSLYTPLPWLQPTPLLNHNSPI